MQPVTSFIYRMINSRTYRTYHLQISRGQPERDGFKTSKPTPELLLWCKKQHWLRYLLHSAAWHILYLFPLLLQLAGSGASAYYPAGNPVHLLSFCLLISFAYLNYHWMAPELFIKKEFSRFFILAFIFLAPVAGSSLIIVPAVATPAAAGSSYFSLPGLQYNLLLFSASIVLPVAIRLQQANTTAKNEIARLQLSLLNTQIKPHFLFNSLNWIYLLSLENARQAPDAILQLSGMMRHMVQEAGEEFTSLKKELTYISNYTALQKGRLGNTVPVQCSVAAYRGNGKIAPLLLMSFIENAFKYGVNPEEDSAIDIDISITGNRLCLQVINNKVSPPENVFPCGYGLANTKQRLQLLYPRNHQLEILEDKKIYSVKLLIAIL